MNGYFAKRGRSFVYAWRGIVKLFKNEPNAQIHLLACVCVITVGLLLGLSPTEWCIVMLCIGGVFMAEGFNTAIEKLCDRVSPERHPLIETAKDVAAGAVLLYVIGVVIAGLIIFVPKIIALFT